MKVPNDLVAILRCLVAWTLTLALTVGAAAPQELTDGWCALSGCDDEEAEQFAEMFAWVQEGIERYVPDEFRIGLPTLTEVIARRGRTFVAQRELQVGQLLMRLPRQRLIHAGIFKECGECPNATLAAALRQGIGENESVDMPLQSWAALFLLEHRRMGRQSDWYPYLNMLPAKFQNNPVFYTEEDFDWLRGSIFVSDAKKHLGNLKQQFQTVSELVPGFAKNYTLEDFMWARSAISTRAYGWMLPSLPREAKAFMVPVGDLFNHKNPKMLRWLYNETTDAFEYWAAEEVGVGDELLTSYGMKANTENVLHYGFADPDLVQSADPVCSVKVAMSLDGVSDLNAKLQWLIKASQWLTKSTDYQPAQFKLRSTWEKESEKMVGHARLLELTSVKELERQTGASSKNCKRVAIPPSCEKPISVSNERAALKKCLRIVQEALQGYPTTLEEDEAKLPSLQGRYYFLVILRRDEKVVLRWWEKYLKLALELLDAGRPYTWTGADRIERRCRDVFSERQCSIKANHYMRITLFELLGGVSVSAAHSKVLNSFRRWLAILAAFLPLSLTLTRDM
eukprot:gnl/TRDRNA2_/TRDRNA2_145613_c1_seq6.p1 gnl/TRDRNA2_/TRDRNA2_145613_c1~~gnl/TRDRNA2_/TRDRNA2_145613_c1_seq6.p1  ORF type:complete len:567 (-),score=97.13 gnl/TRDRNA2_/TRDRNA2_145613_c1_seq6:324-2024(-)